MKTFALVVLLATLASLIGCAAPVSTAVPEVSPVAGLHYVITTDPGMTDGQVAQVAAAAGTWEAAVPGLSFEVYAGTYSDTLAAGTFHRITVRAMTDAALQTYDSNSGDAHVLGGTLRLDSADDAWISLDADAGNQLQAAEHEIGHAMGLEHTSTGVMCKDRECASPSVTAVDVAQFLATRG